ncbi:FtsX-like permease family protein [Malikia sp.]|uniref:FtsX-like permease family protein n=1 Tax=Malikia sp. TaxID=2070706 RepID=UPI00261FED18|nr:ABC transporter permease [Malikia sp.]MDD2727980.1 FtsX-like permease family protein [Malikia sp.]
MRLGVYLALLRSFSWQELRLHPWRHAMAVLAVMLGVGLALSVHLINASALSEFSAAAQSASGEPDAQLRGAAGRLDERWLELVQAQAQVREASPVLELQTQLLDARGQRVSARLWGVDALAMPAIQPALALQPDQGASRLDIFAADAVFLNPAAQRAIGDGVTHAEVQIGLRRQPLRVAGRVAQGGGAPLLVMDVAALQDLSGSLGHLSRIDLRLAPGTSPEALLASLRQAARQSPWARELDPGALLLQRPADAGNRLGQLSRAYRVNLTVLALVALFTGAFLVFSVLSLSVTQRQPSFALLGVLGMDARQRQRLVLAESALVGAAGSVLGVALGTALAWGALRLLGGDLGGGYFGGLAPQLDWSPLAATGYGVLGVGAALLGGWWPALAVRRLAPAQALKGWAMQQGGAGRLACWSGPALLALAFGLCWLPPIAGLPLAAYVAVACGLLGGILALPALVQATLGWLAPRVRRRPLALLALERARRFPHSASVATSAVVASLALSVALTVMVGSFRESVMRWLDAVLPAELYLRAAAGAGGAETALLPPDFVAGVAALPGVARVEGLRLRTLTLDPSRPAVTLIARPLRAAGDSVSSGIPLPLVGPALPWPAATTAPQAPGAEKPVAGPSRIAVFASEALAELHGAQVGREILLPGIGPSGTRFLVAGIWRDYARQQGSLVIDAADYQRLTGDRSINDLAIHLAPDAPADLRARLEQASGGLYELNSAQDIRQISLRIFDRSFAVTYWLQAVAIGMGLMGVSASFSAQVLARRREFGLLQHIGLSRRQVLGLVAAEGALWTLLGAAAGLLLGLAVSVVLVHVVNPQSFHWTMELHLPWGRLLALAFSVVAAGTLTAWLSGRLAASQQAVLAVRQDS